MHDFCLPCIISIYAFETIAVNGTGIPSYIHLGIPDAICTTSYDLFCTIFQKSSKTPDKSIYCLSKINFLP